jgi:glycosyltransferase involved in cell wall biosynthesis
VEFSRRHDDAYLLLHTDIVGQGGVELPVLLASLGIKPERVRFVDQYAYLAGMIDQDVLAAYYTTADVLLAVSMGEGFGIPTIEAQACGTPVIVTDFSAQAELVGAGWTVGWQQFWDGAQAEWFAMPFISGIVDALEQAYAARGDAELERAAIAKGAEYDADHVFVTHWQPVLAEMEAALEPKRNLAIRKRKGKR